MAEQGTLIGELQRAGGRAWRAFRRLPTWAQIVAWVFLGLIALGALTGGSGDNDKTAVADADDALDATADARLQETQSPSEVVTNTPKPQPTATVTPEPLTLEQQFAKSYRDNKGFMARATTEGLTVLYAADIGRLTYQFTTDSALSDGDYLTITSHSAVVASRAVWSTYPDVQSIDTVIRSTFTDQFGVKSTQVATRITIARATGERFAYDGLRDRVLGDNKRLFCTADGYQIHPSIYNALGDTGCLAGARK